MTSLVDYCDSQAGWAVETATTLTSLESPSTDAVALGRIGDWLGNRCAELGGRVSLLDAGSSGRHVVARFGEGDRHVLLLGHMDTVWEVGQRSRMPIRLESGRLYGPGVYDMKAGLAIGMLAVRALSATAGRVPLALTLLVTCDEETDSETARPHIERLALESEAVLVLEPALEGGAVKTSRKGCGEFEISVSGIAAHAGIEPERGASAIHELAEQIGIVERLADPARGLSVNIGTVTGGTRTSVVADQARAGVDIRVARVEDAREVEEAMRSLAPRRPGTSLRVTGGFTRPPLERTPGVARLYEMARAVSVELGLGDLAEGSTGGGSDGNFTGALGVPTLDGLGAVGGGAHALDEHVEVAWLPRRAALVAGLIARLAVLG